MTIDGVAHSDASSQMPSIVIECQQLILVHKTNFQIILFEHWGHRLYDDKDADRWFWFWFNSVGTSWVADERCKFVEFSRAWRSRFEAGNFLFRINSNLVEWWMVDGWIGNANTVNTTRNRLTKNFFFGESEPSHPICRLEDISIDRFKSSRWNRWHQIHWCCLVTSSMDEI